MKRRNILILIAVSIVVIVSIGVIYFISVRHSEEVQEPKTVVELESLDEYGYRLEDRDAELYKSVFNDLRTALDSKEIDFQKYAIDIAKLYIIDLYTIENKLNKYDVGGVDFIYPESKENFSKKVQDTIYKFVEDNTYGKRTQILPNVLSIDVVEVKNEKLTVKEDQVDGYKVKIKWEYVEDLGYDESAIIDIARIEDKLYIIKESLS